MTINISDKFPAPKPDEQAKTRKGRKGDGRQEAILKLQVGESFWVETSIQSASSLRWWARAKEPDRMFTAKTEIQRTKKGVRIWRTE
jgi:hypothetical protein